MQSLNMTCEFDQLLFLRKWSCSGVRIFLSGLMCRKRMVTILTMPTRPSRQSMQHIGIIKRALPVLNIVMQRKSPSALEPASPMSIVLG